MTRARVAPPWMKKRFTLARGVRAAGNYVAKRRGPRRFENRSTFRPPGRPDRAQVRMPAASVYRGLQKKDVLRGLADEDLTHPAMGDDRRRRRALPPDSL